jgi:hypothetical protein
MQLAALAIIAALLCGREIDRFVVRRNRLLLVR